jgi:arylsulfatase A-like enzyme
VPQRKVGPEALDKKGFKWQWLRGLEEDASPNYDSEWRSTRSNYLGMLRLIDDQLKRLVDFLEGKGIRDNTVIVYLSDHGDYFCDYGLIHKGAGMPEDLIRIPMIWSGPGIQHQNDLKGVFVSTADVMPTLCEALGVEIPPGAQGRSLWPLLQNRPYPKEEFRSIYSEVGYGGMYYDRDDRVPYSIAEFHSVPGSKLGFDELDPVTQSGNLKMVRMGDWKLLFDMMGNGELYNVASDPYELKNLFDDPSASEERNRLVQELLTWTIRTQDDLPTAAYKVKWPKRNWYASYRNGGLPPA